MYDFEIWVSSAYENYMNMHKVWFKIVVSKFMMKIHFEYFLFVIGFGI